MNFTALARSTALVAIVCVDGMLSFSVASHADVRKISGLYTDTFGDPSQPALIFVHGGPGYNSYDFEITTAQKLSESGYYVMVYDERGQGRSDLAVDPSDYSYKRYADDIALLIRQLKLKNPVLLGHSHGGPIALKFDQAYPGVAERIILADAPINLFTIVTSISENCIARYQQAGDTANATALSQVQSDLSAIATAPGQVLRDLGTLFADAQTCGGPNGLYMPLTPASTASFLYGEMAHPPFQVPAENIQYPVAAFQNNENYIHLDNTAWVTAHADHIFGVYGDQDGLFTPASLAAIRAALSGNKSPNAYQLISGASHNVFIDQQDKFLQALDRILK